MGIIAQTLQHSGLQAQLLIHCRALKAAVVPVSESSVEDTDRIP